ncbi:hypothetical protein AXG93_3472s1060 [Marchantia polymorpha subsp. ruderalis]|uniref:Uncharacterized protein n=1 Tax=Marchantia polymorpha subsp. ruderalis TaxID=1480154 RepID=A0A176WPD9_MARPO|nr:hypothetical protein AXG93_3472s1060 [Marchantia polymorpha subsp. ruderalis]
MARLEKSREAYDAAVKRSERLITTAEKREKMHVEELAKLEARRAEEARIAEELRGKLLAKTEMRSEESQRKMQKAEDAYRQLRKDSTDMLRLRLEKCLNGEVEIVNVLRRL